MPQAQSPKHTDVLAGEAFGKYVLVKRIAMGGMAEVCLARLQGTAGFNKLVVIKQVLPAFAESPQFVEMFLDEGRLAAKLSHPNIAQTFELGEEQGRHYIAMEFVPGESLYAVLKKCREKGLLLPMGCVLRVQMQLLEALEYAHGLHDESGAPLQLVHRDVTPSNVMVTNQGAIKLLDFGIARAATQVHRTEVGRVKGKGGYMAPEQCRSSKVDQRADVYGAGAVLYLMATGMKPFEHLPPGTDLMAQMNATMEGAFLPPHKVKKDVNPELERIILKAMALKPDDRYQSAGDMLEDLEHFAAKEAVFPSPRELGEFVKKLFPPKAEDGLEASREPSSSRATPGPPRDEKLATGDPSATDDPGTGERAAPSVSARRHKPSSGLKPGVRSDPASQTLAGDDPGTAPSAPAAVAARPAAPPKLLLVVGGGLVLLVLGVAIALKSGGAGEGPPPAVPIARPPIAEPPVALKQGAAAPEPAPAVEPAPAPEPLVEPSTDEGSKPAVPAPPRKPKKKPSEDRSPAVAQAPKAPAPTGVLMINAYPWAKVWLKGKDLGVTPLKLTLPPGDYAIELENPAVNVKKTVKVTVKENAETTHFEKLGQ